MFKDRFWLSLILAIPVVFTSETITDWFGYQLDFAGVDWVVPVLGTVIFIYGGSPFIKGAISEAKDRQPGMMLLIGMAISVAFGASWLASFDVFDVEVWWELSLLIVIMLLGHWMEMRAIVSAHSALAELLPDEADRIADNGEIETVRARGLAVGDIVLIRPGGRVPADGTIVSGQAELDESMITGESNPVNCGEGDRVTAASVAADGSVRVRVDAVGDNTALAGIQRLVAEAQAPDELRATIDEWEPRRGRPARRHRRDHRRRGRTRGPVRPESREAVEALHMQGIKVAMITGDAEQVAKTVAADLGIDEVFAEVLPEDKDKAVTALQARGRTVAMVGDGVNAPALARADVGIAIGAGTDMAIESAGIVLASNDPRGVVAVATLSKVSYRKMQQNLWWAAGHNLLAIPLAAGVLAWAGFVLPMAVGAILMSSSTMIVAIDAQFLRRIDLRPAAI